jgi:O-antigen ligase
MYRQRALFLVLLLSLVSLFVSRAGLSISMVLFIALTCLHNRFGAQLKAWWRQPLLVGISLLFLIPAVSGLWSADTHEWASNARIKLPLLLYPLAFAGSWQLSPKQWKWLAFSFIGLVALGVSWSMGQYLQDPVANNAGFLRAKTFATPLGNDHVRFSWLVTAGLLTIFVLWQQVQKPVRIAFGILAFGLVLYLHVLSARTGLAAFYLLLAAAVIRYLWLRRSPINSVWIVCLSLLLPSLAWSYLPSFRNRIQYIRYDLSYARTSTYLPGSNDGNRLLSIKAGWSILRHNPLGTGSGDIKADAAAWYDANVPGMLPTDRYFPSSEWLAYGGAAGWPGILLFTAIMILPFLVRTRHRFFWTVLNGTAAFSFLFDIGLEVQYGVFLYVFIVLWWWKWLTHPGSTGSLLENLSVVIICRNEEATIARTIQSVRNLSKDIVVYDSGSTDETLGIIRELGLTPHSAPWEGFGRSRRAATALAKNDWVLTVDADEWLTEALAEEIRELSLDHERTVYRIHLSNHMGRRQIQWGAWGGDYRIRLFHKGWVNWNEALIHEKLILPPGVALKTLKGSIEHRTARSFDEYRRKLESYALLTARQYFEQGRRATWLRLHVSPTYTFLKNYLLRLGFLDGDAGWRLSMMMAVYTRKKYGHLQRLEQS